MAKPSWLKLNPSTGSGNGTIANSADAHTGRTARTGTVTVTGVGVSTPSTYKVTQSPKSEFAAFDNGSEMSAPKTAGTVTVEGKTNSSKLTFAWAGSVTDVTLPAKYSAMELRLTMRLLLPVIRELLQNFLSLSNWSFRQMKLLRKLREL